MKKQITWFSKQAAIAVAQRFADQYWIPQTVYRSRDDDGINWRSAASVTLQREPSLIYAVTVLPANYFN